ncbi:MAG TPA: DNA polymerase III subunit beta [Candidatus Paceibacterota bacterium]|nr:DNA polymerase III subunit beta [Candidatus Paceibacterota bacterium]
MKIECIKDKLIDGISKADRLTGKNLSLPILACIYLKAVKNTLVIRATNLDCGIEVRIPAKVEAEGEVALQGAVLNSLLAGLPREKNIVLQSKDGNLLVSTSANTTLIKTFSPDEFPTIPKLDTQRTIEMSPKVLVKGFKSVVYSASQSTVKPELSSVYVYKDGADLVFVSTDSFRLAEKRIKVKEDMDFPSVIIPGKNVNDIIRTLESSTEDVRVLFDKNQIAFEGKDVYLMSRVIDATFPDYKQIIPKVFVTEVVVLKQDFVDSLKTSHVFSDKFNQVNVKALPSKKSFIISTKNSDIGEYTNTIDSSVTGQDVEINFNHKYLSDCFQSIDADSLSISISGANKPLVMRGVSDKSFTYLVMPMNR